jgi:hypothetical protein
MTYPDPIYGSQPLDPSARWYETILPPLANDPETEIWRQVVSAMMLVLLESDWLVHWRTRSVVTALGVHLDALGRDLDFLHPDGWTEDRYRAALIPIVSASYGVRTPGVTAGLADGLAQPGQTWEMGQADALTYCVVFYGVTPDEAELYFHVIRRGKPEAVRFCLVYSGAPKAGTFILDSSLLDGPDLLADMK